MPLLAAVGEDILGMKKKLDYGIILVERLKRTSTQFVDIKTIAEEYDLPHAFLEKIAQEFKRMGWTESQKGRSGGYRLTKTGAAIGVGELINFFERPYEVCPLLRGQYESSRIKIRISTNHELE